MPSLVRLFSDLAKGLLRMKSRIGGWVVAIVFAGLWSSIGTDAQESYRTQQSLRRTIPPTKRDHNYSSEGSDAHPVSTRFHGWKAASAQGSEAVRYFVSHAHRVQPVVRVNPAQSVEHVAPTTLPLPGLGVRPSIPAGILPTGIAVGDFNKDGKLDWAITNGGDNTVYIYFGKGDGTAKPPTIISLAGKSPVAISVGDLNHDGNLDLAIADSDSQTIGLLMGNGDGTFKPETLLPGFAVPTSGVKVLDVNNDGAPDLVVGLLGDSSAGVDSGFAVLMNDGKGNFGSPIYAPTNPPNQFPSAQVFSSGDVNNDGHVDLLVTSVSIWKGTQLVGGSVQTFLGNGDGTFTAGQVLDSSQYGGAGPARVVESAALADMNGDGCLDAIVADTYGTAGVYPGNCQGEFNTTAAGASFYGMGDQLAALTVADVNGDGHPDLITSGATIIQDQIYGYGVALGNMVGVRLNDGSGHFGPLRVYAGEPGMYALAVADLNNSGRSDILSANQDANSAMVFQNSGAGAFGNPSGGYDGEYEGSINGVINSPASGFLATDVNGDGLPDLTLIEDADATTNLLQLTVMLNQGAGVFGQPVRTAVFRSDYFVGDFVFGDFRGTGQKDFLGVAYDDSPSCGQPQLIYAPSTGNGTFGSAVQIPLTLANACYAFPVLAVGDFNHDGKIDFAVVAPISGTATAPLQVSTYLGNGDGTFRAPNQMNFAAPGFDFPPAVFVEDANGDGSQDLLVWFADNVYGPGTSGKDLFEFLSNGDGTFQQPKDVIKNLYAMTMRDLNHDGRLDVIDINSGSPQAEEAPGTAPAVVNTYLGNPDGSFTLKTTISPSPGFLDVFWGNNVSYSNDFNPNPYFGDFNGDGNTDIALFQRTEGLGPAYAQFLVGNGDGTFTPTYDVFDLGVYRAPDLAVENLLGDGRAASIYTPNFAASYAIIPSINAPVIQADIVETPVLTGKDTLQVSLNAPLPSVTTVSLATNDPRILVSSSATIPANATNVEVPFTLGTGFPANQWFEITATANGSTAIAYSYSPALGANDPFSLAVYGGFVPPGQGSSPAPGQDSAWNAIVSTVSMAASTFEISCSGLPTGVSCSNMEPANFTVPPDGSAASNFTITVPLDLAPGSYPFSLAATDGYTTLTTSAALSVGDFTLAINPSSLTAQATSSQNLNLSVNDLFGYEQPVNFSCSELPAGASCTVVASSEVIILNLNQVAPGTYNFTVTGTSNSLVHTANVQLKVISTPVIAFAPALFNIPPVMVGGTSSATIQLSNSGSALLTIASINANTNAGTRLLATSNTCGTGVAPASNCDITVNFAPTSVGSISGTLTINDNATGSPQSLPVTAQGEDFNIQAAVGGSTSATVSAGQSAVFSLQVSPNQFQGLASLQCLNPPPMGSCAVESNVEVTGNSPATFQVTVTTVAPSRSLNAQSRPAPFPFCSVGIGACCLFLGSIMCPRATLSRSVRTALCGVVLSLVIILPGCGSGGGSSGSGGGGGGGGGNPGTPRGNYTLTVNGSADGVTRAVALSLTVN